jgi:hypothetical protein
MSFVEEQLADQPHDLNGGFRLGIGDRSGKRSTMTGAFSVAKTIHS